MQTVRAEVDNQLDGATVANLRSALQQTKEPIETMKEQILQQVGYFIREADDGFQTGVEAIAGESSISAPILLGISFASVLVSALGFVALTVYALCHRGGEAPDGCAVCASSASAMCAAYVFAGTIFFIGGLLLIVTTVGGGVCLAMVEFDQETGKTLLQSLGAPADDSINMALKLADQCMSLKSDSNATRNVADILEFPAQNPSYPGEKSTARQLLADLVASRIDEAFVTLDQAISSQPLTLADHPILAQIRGYLRSVNMKAMYWPSTAEVRAHPTYGAMPEFYYVVSVLCEDLDLPEQLPAVLANVYVPGLNSMVVDGIATGGGPRIPSLFPESSVTWDCPTRLEGDCADSNLPVRDACDSVDL